MKLQDKIGIIATICILGVSLGIINYIGWHFVEHLKFEKTVDAYRTNCLIDGGTFWKYMDEYGNTIRFECIKD